MTTRVSGGATFRFRGVRAAERETFNIRSIPLHRVNSVAGPVRLKTGEKKKQKTPEENILTSKTLRDVRFRKIRHSRDVSGSRFAY